MIRVKNLLKGETCIVEDGKSYLFGSNGRCISEDAGNLSKYMAGALDLPCLSLLSSNGVLDIGVFEPSKDMKRYSSDMSSIDCAMIIQMSGKFIKLLRHDGKQDGVSYNQLIFIYSEDTDLRPILDKIHAKEVI